MAWQPIQLPTINPYAGLSDSVMSGMRMRQDRQQFDQSREDKLAGEEEQKKQHQEALFRAAYDDAIQGYHAGKYTADEVRGKLQSLGAQFDAPPAAPRPPVNPLLRAVAAQRTAPQAIAPAAQASIPGAGGPGPTDALNAAITAKTLDPRQAGPTQPPMMPTPGVSGPPSPLQAPPQALRPPAPQPEAPQNPLLRAAQAGQQQDAARAGALKFRRNGQEYSVSSRDEMLAAQKHEKEAQIQDQLAKFDAALAESDDPYLKRNAQTIRAMIRSGEDIRAQDIFSMTSKEVAQEAQDKRQADRLAQQLSLETGVKEPGRMERAKIGAKSKVQSSSIIADAMKYAADKRGQLGGENNEIKRDTQANAETNTFLRNTKFSQMVQSGRRLREAQQLAAAQGDSAAMAQHEALVELASRANGGALTEGRMNYLAGNMAGKMDWLAQQAAALKNGKLSPEQEAGLMETMRIGLAAYDHERAQVGDGLKKLHAHSKADPAKLNDQYHAYMSSLGEDDQGDPFGSPAPEAPAQNPLQRAAGAGKAQDKFAAAKVDGRLSALKSALATEKDPAKKDRIQRAINAIESGGK